MDGCMDGQVDIEGCMNARHLNILILDRQTNRQTRKYSKAYQVRYTFVYKMDEGKDVWMDGWTGRQKDAWA